MVTKRPSENNSTTSENNSTINNINNTPDVNTIYPSEFKEKSNEVKAETREELDLLYSETSLNNI